MDFLFLRFLPGDHLTIKVQVDRQPVILNYRLHLALIGSLFSTIFLTVICSTNHRPIFRMF